MSSQQNIASYESANERFWGLLDSNYDFKFVIYANFLNTQDQWLEKENGRIDTDCYDNAFDCCWRWDAEGMARDIEGTVIKYLMKGMNDKKEIS